MRWNPSQLLFPLCYSCVFCLTSFARVLLSRPKPGGSFPPIIFCRFGGETVVCVCVLISSQGGSRTLQKCKVSSSSHSKKWRYFEFYYGFFFGKKGVCCDDVKNGAKWGVAKVKAKGRRLSDEIRGKCPHSPPFPFFRLSGIFHWVHLSFPWEYFNVRRKKRVLEEKFCLLSEFYHCGRRKRSKKNPGNFAKIFHVISHFFATLQDGEN